MKRRSYHHHPLEVIQLDWHHNGVPHRVRLSGAHEVVVFEWQPDGIWEPFVPDPSSETFESAALDIIDESWRDFVLQLPPAWQDFLGWFRCERLEALAVLSRCPDLLPHLEVVPSLTLFVALHANLRSPGGPRWNEINALYERENIYGVLGWLGLPPTPHTLALLADATDPEPPRHDLPTIRAALWDTSHHPLAA